MKKSEPASKDWDLDRERPSWDQDLAQELVGSLVLVGMTELDAAGGMIEKSRFYGRVSSADRTQGIRIPLEGHREGQTCNLPPHTRAFKRPKLGKYTLRSTGEVVVDPDFTTSWTFQEPAN